MPRYTYSCSECGELFEVFHLMSETYDICDLCGSENCITRVPSQLFNIKLNHTKEKVGNLVKKHIEEAKHDLKKEKRKLKNKQL